MYDDIYDQMYVFFKFVVLENFRGWTPNEEIEENRQLWSTLFYAEAWIIVGYERVHPAGLDPFCAKACQNRRQEDKSYFQAGIESLNLTCSVRHTIATICPPSPNPGEARSL